jgi:L-seryl-tRNA(Ser) seleniumtransferase
MLAEPAAAIRARALALVSRLGKHRSISLEVERGASFVGGGAAPDAEIPTWVVAISGRERSAESLLEALRRHDPPIIARISEDRVLLDLRTVSPEEEPVLESALKRL